MTDNTKRSFFGFRQEHINATPMALVAQDENGKFRHLLPSNPLGLRFKVSNEVHNHHPGGEDAPCSSIQKIDGLWCMTFPGKGGAVSFDSLKAAIQSSMELGWTTQPIKFLQENEDGFDVFRKPGALSPWEMEASVLDRAEAVLRWPAWIIATSQDGSLSIDRKYLRLAGAGQDFCVPQLLEQALHDALAASFARPIQDLANLYAVVRHVVESNDDVAVEQEFEKIPETLQRIARYLDPDVMDQTKFISSVANIRQALYQQARRNYVGMADQAFKLPNDGGSLGEWLLRLSNTAVTLAEMEEE